MDVSGSSFGFVTSLFMPAEAGKLGVVMHPAGDWTFAPELFPADIDAAAWGRPPIGSDTPLPQAVRQAIQRELALRSLASKVPSGYRRRAIHRLPPPTYGIGGSRSAIRGLVLSGAIVSVERDTGTPTVLDGVAEAASLVRTERLRLGAGVAASLLAWRSDGRKTFVRLGPAGGRDDPARIARCLDMLLASGVDHVPRVLARGRVGATSWTVESLLPGRRPRALTSDLVVSVARSLARLPRQEGPPAAHRDDLEIIAGAFPDRRPVLDAIGRRIDHAVGSMPGVLRHGDLWAGNLLIQHRSLCGIVDWDTWHPSGVPAADLLHMIVTDLSMKTRRPRGTLWAARPWTAPMFKTVLLRNWPTSVPVPDERSFEAIAHAGWAAQVAANLTHSPELSRRQRWISGNIDPITGR